MKILFVTANLGPGGAERVISLLANQLVRRGHEVEVAFLKKRLIFYPLDDQVKTVVLEELCGSSSLWKKMQGLRRYVRNNNPDVVVPFRISVYTTTIVCLLGSNARIVASERIDPHVADGLWTLMRKLVLPFVGHLVVQTQYIKSYYPSFIRKKTTVIANPVSEKITICKDNKVDKSMRIISVARLFPQKNQEMMIRAFAKVAPLFPDWQLVIYGEGPKRENLQMTIDSLQMTDRVLLPGRTERVAEELKRSDIFCMSSDYEGMSNSMIEAICSGLPVVTTRVSGTEELIEDGKNGFVVERGDETAMATRLSQLMSDENMRSAMRKQNISKAHYFGIDYVTEKWENVFKNLIND